MSQAAIKAIVINDGMLHTRNVILRCICAAYLIAFASFYHQSPGLFGENGILPARVHIDTSTSMLSAFAKTPTLLHFGRVFGLNTESTIDLFCLVGMIVSSIGFISVKCCLLPVFAIQWILYFSLYQITDIFGHQSDQLLLEAGFICIILAPIIVNRHSTPMDKIVLVLLKWILFRFLFTSGAVKVISRCPKWWTLTAMEIHFETLPLPTVFAYFAHNLPASTLKAFNIFMLASELAVPWLFFFPHRTLRRAVFYWQVYYQLCILMTGNYGLQPLLLLILSLTLLDDTFFDNQTPVSLVMHILKCVLILSVLFVVAALSLPSFYLPLSITTTFLKTLVKVIHTAPVSAILVLILTAIGNLLSHPLKAYSRSMMQRLYFVNTTIGITIVTVIFLVVSMVPLSRVDNSTNINNSNLGEYYESVKKFHIVNEYGMHLRKMRSERLEVIFEHSQNAEGPWTEYGYLYKPWNRNHTSSFTGFYLPRLDAEFYDAISSSYRDNLWTASLAHRLLENQPQVLQLLGVVEPLDPPPKYVRAGKYKLWYTTIDSKKAYWTKALRGEYLPAVTIDNALILSYLRSLKISQKTTNVEEQWSWLSEGLAFLRRRTKGVSGPQFTWTTVMTAVLVILSKKLFGYLKNNKHLFFV